MFTSWSGTGVSFTSETGSMIRGLAAGIDQRQIESLVHLTGDGLLHDRDPRREHENDPDGDERKRRSGKPHPPLGSELRGPRQFAYQQMRVRTRTLKDDGSVLKILHSSD
jgi:hypothetical protein